MPYYCKFTSFRLVMLISKSKFNPYSKANLDICEEKSSEEIGKITFISKRTVHGIRSKILSRMNVKTEAGVVILLSKIHYTF